MLQDDMENELQQLKQQALQEIFTAKSVADLESLEIRYFGRQSGSLTKILRSLANLSLEEKKKIGSLANQIKQELTAAFNKKQKELKNKKSEEFFDVTLPGKKPEEGHLHPLTQVRMELEEIFKSMGFEIFEGDELTTDYYNFESLNFPKDHPARDTQNTFFVKSEIRNPKSETNSKSQIPNSKKSEDWVLRTHTSAMQVKIMEEKRSPLKVIVPGKCFRNEATDVRHEHTFHHLEGFAIDRNISLAQMKGILELVIKQLFGQSIQLRLRPKYYPFVEPGVNGEVTCFLCHGKGCRLCKASGWLEIFGAGMIHPYVLKAGGIDPKKWSGFAFGFGLTRLAMLKYGIDDVRLFMSGDLRFLKQF